MDGRVAEYTTYESMSCLSNNYVAWSRSFHPQGKYLDRADGGIKYDNREIVLITVPSVTCLVF